MKEPLSLFLNYALWFQRQNVPDVDLSYVRSLIADGKGFHLELDDGRMIPNFITQALRNKLLTIYGDGSKTRSICYISDLVEGLIGTFNHTLYVNPSTGCKPGAAVVRPSRKMEKIDKN